nr:hypothetical protein GCM10020092_050600 [Actinoplanes digitatis]
MSRAGKYRPPSPRRRPNEDRTWSVDDALREYVKLIRWFDTGDGVRGVYRFYQDFYHGDWPASLPDEPTRWQHAETTAADSATALRQADPVWCDPPMVDLLAAAADTYPIEAIEHHHLLQPDGIVIFAKTLPVIWHDEAGHPTDQQLSAISWAEGRSTRDGQPLLGITGWQRAAGVYQFDQPRFAVRYTGLRPASNAISPYGAVFPDADAAGPHRLLQTLTALCHTTLVRDQIAPASKAARREATRAGLTDPPIRRIYLRRPEHGKHELDAARDSHAGGPPRGHWVRGHWKNQWHPSISEHRPIWVAGYPRGDFTAEHGVRYQGLDRLRPQVR